MTDDPRAILALERMSPRQAVAVGLCVLLVALDGFDVLAISFASPGIAKEWGIDRASLGIVLSMEIIGMALGSFTLGNVADRIGRRPTVLGCLVVMTAGMFLATSARSVELMSVFRFMTGLGIGGMLAAINAVAAECANNRRRNLAVSLMAAGYPLGAVAGGTIATQLLAGGNWRSVFMFGAIATAVCIPLVLWLLPESVSYLIERRPSNALARINSTLRRLGHRAVQALPPTEAAHGEQGLPGRALLAAARALDGPADRRLFRAHHDLLLHAEVDPEDRRGHGLRALERRRRACVGQRRRRLRCVAVQRAHPASRVEKAGDRRTAAHGRDDRALRPVAAGTRPARDARARARASSATPGSSASTRCSRSPSRRGSVRAAPAS